MRVSPEAARHGGMVIMDICPRAAGSRRDPERHDGERQASAL